MKKLLTPFLILLLAMPVLAGDRDQIPEKKSDENTDMIGQYVQEIGLEDYQRMRQLTDFSLASSGFEDFPMSSDIFETNYRSPGKSFLYSMAVPGTGQLYTDSKVKAFIFMGIEAIAWAGYYIYQKDGTDKEESYKDYADQYWDPEQYYNWLVEEHGLTDDYGQIFDEDGNPTTFTHHLPETKSQQYYEMIGKYDQFRYGWVDTDYRRGKETSELRESYLVDRDEANDAFNKAKIGAIVAIANHLVSAFDAALTARRYNREQDTFTEYKVRPSMKSYEGESMPTLTFIYKF